MARQEVVKWTDDLTGKETTSAQTVLIIVGRETFELDVAVSTYIRQIEPLINAGRKVSAGNVVQLRPGAVTSPAKIDKAQNQALRNWWSKNAGREGVPSFNVRGRIPASVQEMFQTHGGRDIPQPAPELKPLFIETPDGATVTRQRRAAPAKTAAATKPVRKTVRAKTPAKVPEPTLRKPIAAAGKSPRKQGTRGA